MTASEFEFSPLWHVAGWTMLHYLWTGAIVCFLAALVRWSLRRFSPQVRYLAMLASLVALALLPIVIAVELEKPGFFAFTPNHENFAESLNNPKAGLLAAAAPQDSGAFVSFEKSSRFYSAPNDEYLANSLADPRTAHFPRAESEKPGFLPSQPEIDDSANSFTVSKAGLLKSLVTHKARLLHLLQRAVPHLPWLWIIGTPLTFLWLATGFVGAERLRRSSRPVREGPVVNLCAELSSAIGVAVHVGIAVCDRIAGPVLVGIVKPTILLPPAALSGWTPEQIEMVLLHELAHVRRWDNLVNLLQRTVEALFFFHPAVWMVSAWIRRDREACCDALVVARTGQPQRYAETLVALATTQFSSPLAVSAYSRHPLTARIRNILKLEDDSMVVSRKTWVISLSILLAAAFFGMSYLPHDGQAQNAPDAENPLDNELEMVVDEQVITAKSDGERIVLATRKEDSDQDTPAAESPPAESVNSTEGNATSESWLFPSLDEQKMADRGWKMLGLELEKISDEDLERVKKLGYPGGLKVVALDYDLVGPKPIIHTGDILIGLHAWPTESLDHLGEILSREDIAELSPLKFYVLRREQTRGQRRGKGEYGLDGGGRGYEGGYGARGGEGYGGETMMGGYGEFGMEASAPQDTIVTGRIDVHESPKSKQESKVKRTDQPLPLLSSYPESESSTPADTSQANPATGSPASIQRRTGRSGRGMEFRREAEAYRTDDGEAQRRTDGRGFGRGDYFYGQPTADKPPAAISSIKEEETSGSGFGYERTNQEIWERTRQELDERTKRELYYDGKTFDEWRDQWRTELKMEPRLEAIKALAAFGAAGRGKEAAELILEVASQYDWTSASGNTSKLKEACVEAFLGNGDVVPGRIPTEDWLPILLEKLRSEDPSLTSFSHWILPRLGTDAEFAIEPLLELSRTASPQVRDISLRALATIDANFRDPRVKQRWLELLASDDPTIITTALLNLNSSAYLLDIDIIELMLHPDAAVRRKARLVAQSVPSNRTKEVVDELIDRLETAESTEEQQQVIRAMGAIGPQAANAFAMLYDLAQNPALELPLRATAVVALERIRGYQNENEWRTMLQRQDPNAQLLVQQFAIQMKLEREEALQ